MSIKTMFLSQKKLHVFLHNCTLFGVLNNLKNITNCDSFYTYIIPFLVLKITFLTLFFK